MKWLTSALGLSMMVLASQATWALEKPKMAFPEKFAQADANKDGQVSSDEAKGKLPFIFKNFATIDTDHNGLVSMSEAQNYQLQKRFAKLDVNHDNQLSENEVQTAAPRLYKHFAKIDNDKNGSLSLSELQALQAAKVAKVK